MTNGGLEWKRKIISHENVVYEPLIEKLYINNEKIINVKKKKKTGKNRGKQTDHILI